MLAPRHHAIELMRTRFAADPMPLMRAEALSSLVRLGDEGALPFVRTHLEMREPSVQADCLEGLSAFRDPEVIDAVVPFLDDPHPNLRRLALLVLWDFPEERPGLMRVVQDLFPTLREDDYRRLPLPSRATYLVGIRLVGDLRLASAIPSLQDGLAWDDATVRLECACSLLHLGCADGVEDVRVRLRWGDEEARRRIDRLPVDTRPFFG